MQQIPDTKWLQKNLVLFISWFSFLIHHVFDKWGEQINWHWKYGWTKEAEDRLKNIPDFIQPMARKEIERLAKERGATTVSAELMDEAKEKFMKFM